jgi:hypothetical protein
VRLEMKQLSGDQVRPAFRPDDDRAPEPGEDAR